VVGNSAAAAAAAAAGVVEEGWSGVSESIDKSGVGMVEAFPKTVMTAGKSSSSSSNQDSPPPHRNSKGRYTSSSSSSSIDGSAVASASNAAADGVILEKEHKAVVAPTTGIAAEIGSIRVQLEAQKSLIKSLQGDIEASIESVPPPPTALNMPLKGEFPVEMATNAPPPLLHGPLPHFESSSRIQEVVFSFPAATSVKGRLANNSNPFDDIFGSFSSSPMPTEQSESPPVEESLLGFGSSSTPTGNPFDLV